MNGWSPFTAQQKFSNSNSNQNLNPKDHSRFPGQNSTNAGQTQPSVRPGFRPENENWPSKDPQLTFMMPRMMPGNPQHGQRPSWECSTMLIGRPPSVPSPIPMRHGMPPGYDLGIRPRLMDHTYGRPTFVINSNLPPKAFQQTQDRDFNFKLRPDRNIPTPEIRGHQWASSERRPGYPFAFHQKSHKDITGEISFNSFQNSKVPSALPPGPPSPRIGRAPQPPIRRKPPSSINRYYGENSGAASSASSATALTAVPSRQSSSTPGNNTRSRRQSTAQQKNDNPASLEIGVKFWQAVSGDNFGPVPEELMNLVNDKCQWLTSFRANRREKIASKLANFRRKYRNSIANNHSEYDAVERDSVSFASLEVPLSQFHGVAPAAESQVRIVTADHPVKIKKEEIVSADFTARKRRRIVQEKSPASGSEPEIKSEDVRIRRRLRRKKRPARIKQSKACSDEDATNREIKSEPRCSDDGQSLVDKEKLIRDFQDEMMRSCRQNAKVLAKYWIGSLSTVKKAADLTFPSFYSRINFAPYHRKIRIAFSIPTDSSDMCKSNQELCKEFLENDTSINTNFRSLDSTSSPENFVENIVFSSMPLLTRPDIPQETPPTSPHPQEVTTDSESCVGSLRRRRRPNKSSSSIKTSPTAAGGNELPTPIPTDIPPIDPCLPDYCIPLPSVVYGPHLGGQGSVWDLADDFFRPLRPKSTFSSDLRNALPPLTDSPTDFSSINEKTFTSFYKNPPKSHPASSASSCDITRSLASIASWSRLITTEAPHEKAKVLNCLHYDIFDFPEAEPNWKEEPWGLKTMLRVEDMEDLDSIIETAGLDVSRLELEEATLLAQLLWTLSQQEIIWKEIKLRTKKQKSKSHWKNIIQEAVEIFKQEYYSYNGSIFNYNLKHQSFDLCIFNLINFQDTNARPPIWWTEKALCSVCENGDDSDADPITFCDICFVSCHGICSGQNNLYPETSSKKNIRLTRRHNTRSRRSNKASHPGKEDSEERSWICEACTFVMDHISDNDKAVQCIRLLNGPRSNKEYDAIVAKDATNARPAWKVPKIVASRNTQSAALPAGHLQSPQLNLLAGMLSGKPHGSSGIFSNSAFRSDINRHQKDNYGKVVPPSGDINKSESTQKMHIYFRLYLDVNLVSTENKEGSPKKDEESPFATEQLRQDSLEFTVKVPKCVLCGFDAFVAGGGPCKLAEEECKKKSNATQMIGSQASNQTSFAHVRCALSIGAILTRDVLTYPTPPVAVKNSNCKLCNRSGLYLVKCHVADCNNYYHMPCATRSSQIVTRWETVKTIIYCVNHSRGRAPTANLMQFVTSTDYLMNQESTPVVQWSHDITPSILQISNKEPPAFPNDIPPYLGTVSSMIGPAGRSILGLGHVVLEDATTTEQLFDDWVKRQEQKIDNSELANSNLTRFNGPRIFSTRNYFSVPDCILVENFLKFSKTMVALKVIGGQGIVKNCGIQMRDLHSEGERMYLQASRIKSRLLAILRLLSGNSKIKLLDNIIDVKTNPEEINSPFSILLQGPAKDRSLFNLICRSVNEHYTYLERSINNSITWQPSSLVHPSIQHLPLVHLDSMKQIQPTSRYCRMCNCAYLSTTTRIYYCVSCGTSVCGNCLRQYLRKILEDFYTYMSEAGGESTAHNFLRKQLRELFLICLTSFGGLSSAKFGQDRFISVDGVPWTSKVQSTVSHFFETTSDTQAATASADHVIASFLGQLPTTSHYAFFVCIRCADLSKFFALNRIQSSCQEKQDEIPDILAEPTRILTEATRCSLCLSYGGLLQPRLDTLKFFRTFSERGLLVQVYAESLVNINQQLQTRRPIRATNRWEKSAAGTLLKLLSFPRPKPQHFDFVPSWHLGWVHSSCARAYIQTKKETSSNCIYEISNIEKRIHPLIACSVCGLATDAYLINCQAPDCQNKVHVSCAFGSRSEEKLESDGDLWKRMCLRHASTTAACHLVASSLDEYQIKNDSGALHSMSAILARGLDEAAIKFASLATETTLEDAALDTVLGKWRNSIKPEGYYHARTVLTDMREEEIWGEISKFLPGKPSDVEIGPVNIFTKECIPPNTQVPKQVVQAQPEGAKGSGWQEVAPATFVMRRVPAAKSKVKK
eukprot:GHVP01064173.1.p1 GENE.GHVP01064173.1~~GHVP01064173.1.p1  ORF type:complete len:2104 (+),score=288.03 GHVP01064173.1:536-6847(+)